MTITASQKYDWISFPPKIMQTNLVYCNCKQSQLTNKSKLLCGFYEKLWHMSTKLVGGILESITRLW